MENIRNLIKRIGAEAETVEDMEQLLLSELDAYEKFRDNHLGHITLWPKTRISGTVAYVGELDGYPIALYQKMKNKILKSEYKVQ